MILIPRSLVRVASCLVLLVGLAMCVGVRADCDISYGDQLHAWVQNDARSQSLALIEADFTSRLNNGRVVEYDSLKAQVPEIAATLDALSTQLTDGDRRRTRLDELAASLDLESEATDVLNKLLALAGDITALTQRLKVLEAPADRVAFRSMGGQHVGRSTLLSSIGGFTANRGDTLNSRYSFYMQVSFDGDGKLKNSEGGLKGNQADAAATGILFSPNAEPISKAIAAIYLIIRGVDDVRKNDECEERIRHQAKRAGDALRLLDKVLPTETEVFGIYKGLLGEAQKRFASNHVENVRAVSTLEARWRNLLAFTLARLDVASKTLTVEKVERLRRAYDTTDSSDLFFKEAALTQMTQQLRELKRFAQQEELLLGDACRNAPGVAAAENLLDRRREAAAQIDLVRKLNSLAPLRSEFGTVDEQLQRPVQRAEKLTRPGSYLKCAAPRKDRGARTRLDNTGAAQLPQVDGRISVETKEPPRSKSEINVPGREQAALVTRLSQGENLNENGALSMKYANLASRGVQRLMTLPRQVGVTRGSWRASEKTPSPFRALAVSQGSVQTALMPDGGSFCTIYKAGNLYRCGSPGNGDPGLIGEFPSAPGSPYRTIGEGSKDGGFGVDTRQLELDIAQAKSGIDKRISDLKTKNQAIAVAIPIWIVGNAEGMSALGQTYADKLTVESSARDAAAARDSIVLRETAQRLARFSRDRADPSLLRDLMHDIGALDSSLPNLPADVVMPDGPSLPGLTHRERVYPRDATTVQRRIAREKAKGWKLKDRTRQELHGRLTETAVRFAVGRRPGGEAIASALVLDAASLRFAESGALPEASLSTIAPNGEIVRRPYVGGAIPGNAIVMRVQRFDSESKFLDQQQSLARTALADGTLDRRPRLAALNLSTQMSGAARGVFYSGEILDGEALLETAKAVANLVTAWAPGISWGRDIYETITGADLITGEELDEFSRTFAIVGAITGGIASKGIHSVEVVSRGIKRYAPNVERLLDHPKFAPLAIKALEKIQSIRGETAKFFDHATEKLVTEKLRKKALKDYGADLLNITEHHVRKVVEIGHPFFDKTAVIEGGKNSGLVYMARAEKVGIHIANGKKIPLLAVPVELEGAHDWIKSAYWLDEAYSIGDVEKIPFRAVYGLQKIEKERRFVMLPRKGQ